jgi:hypothetical protein
MGVENECQTSTKYLLSQRIRELQLYNQLQEVAVFHENMIRCSLLRNNNIEAILSLNGEKCFLGISRNE